MSVKAADLTNQTSNEALIHVERSMDPNQEHAIQVHASQVVEGQNSPIPFTVNSVYKQFDIKSHDKSAEHNHRDKKTRKAFSPSTNAAR